jgi:hypothetical protein
MHQTLSNLPCAKAAPGKVARQVECLGISALKALVLKRTDTGKLTVLPVVGPRHASTILNLLCDGMCFGLAIMDFSFKPLREWAERFMH